MRIRVRGWRWRSNPLRRRSDVVEAWTALVVAVLLLVGAPLAGSLAGRWAHDEARAVASAQRADRHRVRAEVVGDLPDALPVMEDGRRRSYRVTVRWTPPGERPRLTAARVPAGTRTGDTVTVWLDSRGRGVAAPPDETAVWQHTLTIGTCVALGAGTTVLLAHAVVRRVALRRRLGEWERDWARTEPQWTRRHNA
ncbi:hypothetical protein OG739_05240 [Streptomyces longwoodensis]|uniref:Rv1733c family protein n=1 Tax=Streptomyces longwoodensis TaxID=68231 RepID=UPI002254E7E7|nr:DUF3592 domain-containing protein [Streptomyces longwoodensis]MCX4999881.1 hypothetical protein [Streptomyces longwoodensis]WTI48609.1 hypothetical protein OG547_30825 [Streptomyces longwoodensis]WUC61338.1 hypothetical protein OHA09_31710 [Streptomyces longwoodensis]WUC74883.1 hypothetical protein OG416_30790 [Streptomyces longwoodensis]